MFPHSPQPGPRPGPPPGGFRPGPPPSAQEHREAEPVSFTPRPDGSTGHPAVDAVLQSLANAAQLPPADQIAEYEAAHRILLQTLSGIDG
jgi:hypothetical protein